LTRLAASVAHCPFSAISRHHEGDFICLIRYGVNSQNAL
jgi:hypothetical protein